MSIYMEKFAAKAKEFGIWNKIRKAIGMKEDPRGLGKVKEKIDELKWRIPARARRAATAAKSYGGKAVSHMKRNKKKYIGGGVGAVGLGTLGYMAKEKKGPFAN